ncbi:hypothetical protein GGS21DRAFT_489210 [Xylaria nigripes]|nr:hypothetical protein GGS21DRAFT_489210 [Xylaria nigripes]
MSLMKQQISPPIEAGRSILDTHNLPSRLSCMLEYVSKRLTRKRLHITLIVVKDEYQLPTTPPCATPISPPQTPDRSSSGFGPPPCLTSSVVGLRKFVRRGTACSTTSTNSSSSTSSSASEVATGMRTSPTSPPPQSESLASPRRFPGTSIPSTPMTPHTPSSFATTTTTTSQCGTGHRSQSTAPFWERLVYASPVSQKEDKIIQAIIIKAERKFEASAGELPAITTASACGLNADLMRQSIRQNELLFSSEGLTLLGLDRLYSFKAALTAYAKSISTSNSRMRTPLFSPGLSNHPVNLMPQTPTSGIVYNSRLEDAVDSLRRLVLSNGDRPVPRADLYRSFDWMGVNPTALADVERMYRRGYGGPERRGPFEAHPILKDEEEAEQSCEMNQQRRSFVKLDTPPPRKSDSTSALRVYTDLNTASRRVRHKPIATSQVSESDNHVISGREIGIGDDNDKTRRERHTNDGGLEIDSPEIAAEQVHEYHGDGNHVAFPIPDGPLPRSMLWFRNSSLTTSIDEMLLPWDDRQSQVVGPITPNNYGDISPTTRGEWGFLFKGETWTQPRTAAVETF